MKRFGFQPCYEGDAGGGAGGAASAPATAPASSPAPATAPASSPAAATAPATTPAAAPATAPAAPAAAPTSGDATTDRLAQLERDLSDTKTKLEQAEQARVAETAKQNRTSAAAAAGLSAEWADRLVGTTPEELAADAKKIALQLGPTAPGTGATNPSATRGGASLEDQVNADWANRRKGGFRF